MQKASIWSDETPKMKRRSNRRSGKRQTTGTVQFYHYYTAIAQPRFIHDVRRSHVLRSHVQHDDARRGHAPHSHARRSCGLHDDAPHDDHRKRPGYTKAFPLKARPPPDPRLRSRRRTA